jgi:hypothetical protein
LYTYFGCKPEYANAAGSQKFFFPKPGTVGLTRQIDPGSTSFETVHAALAVCPAHQPPGPHHRRLVRQAAVDKPMHIHRSECAEARLLNGAQNLCTFGASAIQRLFSTSKRR